MYLQQYSVNNKVSIYVHSNITYTTQHNTIILMHYKFLFSKVRFIKQVCRETWQNLFVFTLYSDFWLFMFFCTWHVSSCIRMVTYNCLQALYDYQPSENDAQPALAWLAVMQEAHINLLQLNVQLGLSHLPRFFQAAVSYFLTEKTEVAHAACDTLKVIVWIIFFQSFC